MLFTISEVAKLLRVSTRTVYRLVNEGEIESVLVGRQRRFPAETLRRYGVDPELIDGPVREVAEEINDPEQDPLVN